MYVPPYIYPKYAGGTRKNKGDAPKAFPAEGVFANPVFIVEDPQLEWKWLKDLVEVGNFLSQSPTGLITPSPKNMG